MYCQATETDAVCGTPGHSCGCRPISTCLVQLCQGGRGPVKQARSDKAGLLLRGLQQGGAGGCALLLGGQQHPPALPQGQQVLLHAYKVRPPGDVAGCTDSLRSCGGVGLAKPVASCIRTDTALVQVWRDWPPCALACLLCQSHLSSASTQTAFLISRASSAAPAGLTP